MDGQNISVRVSQNVCFKRWKISATANGILCQMYENLIMFLGIWIYTMSMPGLPDIK